jgi:catechol 2,3-dioxygenase-like lactoylglutathione lyase family enzyme
MTTPFKPRGLAVVSLRAKDVSQAVHFYRDVLGLPLLPHHDHRPAFDLDGVYLVIVEGEPGAAQGSEAARFPVLAFEVEDLDKALGHLGDHGVALPWGVERGEGSRWALFHDPAGNLLEFVQFRVAE